MDSKILNHPDREEIIQRLLNGMSPTVVHKWLLSKYPDEKQNHITVAAINKFRIRYLDINKEAARFLKKERQKQALGLPSNPNLSAFVERPFENEKAHAIRVKDTLLNSPTYRDK